MTDPEDTTEPPTKSRARVFVSYRREDTKHVAGWLRERLVRRLGERAVFVDVTAIEPGLNYVEAIDKAIGSCDVMLVLIGDGWLTATDGEGRRRLDNPNDRLRLEVEAGLRKRTRVIPVVVDSASMPRSVDLPGELAPLAEHHAARLRHESFNLDADHLLTVVDRVVGDRALPPPPPPDGGRARLRSLAVGLLSTVVLAHLVLRAGAHDPVSLSRFPSSPDGPWGSLVWLLPSLPVLAAALLVATRKRYGAALGCILSAVLWVALSLLFIVDKQQDAAGAHLLVLVLLLASLVSFVLAVPETRARMPANRADRAILAGLLAVVAVVLRVQPDQIASVLTSTASAPTDWGDEVGRPRFWIAVLGPVLICLPAALLACNRTQAQALVTLAALQIAYVVALSSMRVVIAVDAQTPLGLADDLVVLGGAVVMLLAVLVGQRPGARSA